MDLATVCDLTGRPATALTRRDVVRVLLTEPSGEALAGLPALRRAMVAAGNPLSAAFWDSVTTTLTSIDRGAATVGDVKAWMASTGTQPVDLLELFFFWPEEDDAGPAVQDLHARLVTHLESLVSDGTIDPDLLVAEDAAALAAYRQHQVEWLRTALPDGRVPLDTIMDEEDDALLAAWDDAESDAFEVLTGLLQEIGDRPCPSSDLAAAATRLRWELRSDLPGTAQLRAASGVDPEDLPTDDAELWLTLAAGVVAQQDEPPRDQFDEEVLAAWSALGHADWIAAAVTLATDGPGAELDITELAERIAAFDFEAIAEGQGDDEVFSDDLDASDAAGSIAIGLYPVVHLWQQLGALDPDERLTPLGWWGIPESLLRAWLPPGPDAEG